MYKVTRYTYITRNTLYIYKVTRYTYTR